ncbi:hypothetical protein LINPERHAP1_LOCUS30798 [Linum perenne]
MTFHENRDTDNVVQNDAPLNTIDELTRLGSGGPVRVDSVDDYFAPRTVVGAQPGINVALSVKVVTPIMKLLRERREEEEEDAEEEEEENAGKEEKKMQKKKKKKKKKTQKEEKKKKTQKKKKKKKTQKEEKKKKTQKKKKKKKKT